MVSTYILKGKKKVKSLPLTLIHRPEILRLYTIVYTIMYAIITGETRKTRQVITFFSRPDSDSDSINDQTLIHNRTARR